MSTEMKEAPHHAGDNALQRSLREKSTPVKPSPNRFRRGGRLSFAQQWKILAGTLRWRLHPRQSECGEPTLLQQLDLKAFDHIRPPTDALAQAALRAANTLHPPWLTQHVLRTYLWGSFIGLNAGYRYDNSLFFSACALHDLGLTPHADQPAEHCFAVRGARAAQHLLIEAGGSVTQAATVAHAIVLHLELEVPARQGLEAHLLHAGAGIDVIGRRTREIPPALKQAVLDRHPRLEMKKLLGQCMCCEAQRAPDTRAGVLVNRLGFVDLIAKAPFAE
jgi:hypothetical protein